MKRSEINDEQVPLLAADNDTTQLQCQNNRNNNRHKKSCKCVIFKNKMDGGYSWLITTSSFFVQFCVVGFINNVSALNSFWVDEFNITPGIVAWVGSINVGCMFLSAPLAALLDKKIGCQATGTIGCILCVCGILLSSFSTNFIALLLSYGVIFGLGASCCFFSSILIQAKYFDKRLALSNGIVTAGSGAGTLTISALAHSYYSKFGWRNGIQYYSIVFFALTLIKLLYNDLVVDIRICRPDKSNTRRNKLHISPYIWLRTTASDLCPLALFKNIPFLIFNISCVFFMLGYFVPYIHLVFYAENQGIDKEHSNFLIGYMAIASLCGKLITGKIAELPSVSPIFFMIGSFVAIGLSHIAATMATTLTHFIAYSIVFGLFDGAYNCLVTVVVCDLIGRNQLGSGIGILFCVKSIPLMCGGPLAGFIFDCSKSYFLPFLICGIFIFVAVYLMLIIPIYDLYHGTNVYRYIAVSFNDSMDKNIDTLYLNQHHDLDNESYQHENIQSNYPITQKANSCSEYAIPNTTENSISANLTVETFLSADLEDQTGDHLKDISE